MIDRILKRVIIKLLLIRKITIKTLDHYIPYKFQELFPDNMYNPEYDKYGDSITNERDLLREIKEYGLIEVKDIEKIVKNDLIDSIKFYGLKLNYLSLMRLIMITNDLNRYFDGLNTFFVQWDLYSLHSWDTILTHYDITPEMLDKKIGEQKKAEQLLKTNRQQKL